MPRRRSHSIEFGSWEKTVRWVEETAPDRFGTELEKKLSKVRSEKLTGFLQAGALASIRSTRPEGEGPLPHGRLILSSVRSLLDSEASSPESASAGRLALAQALRLINQEIHSPHHGPFDLPVYASAAAGSKEEILYDFLEAVRAGETARADERFTWLVRDLDKDQATDLLISAGLEGVTGDAHKIVSVVEAAFLLQGMGWEWAPVFLRPVVRLQASGPHGHSEYERGRELVADRALLRLARRRPPGQLPLGERDPEGFLERAYDWAEADAEGRMRQSADCLRDGLPLEDLGEILILAASLLFLQEALRSGAARWSESRADRALHLITGPRALCRLVRLGTPGQRILGLLLVGALPEIREIRLQRRTPESGWWLTPVSRMSEPSPASSAALNGERAEQHPAPPAWRQAILDRKPNGLLPLIEARLGAGASALALEPVLSELAPQQARAPGLALKLERSLIEAYRGTRSPHRWIHLWSAALALCLWPTESGTEKLHPSGAMITIPPVSSPGDGGPDVGGAIV